MNILKKLIFGNFNSKTEASTTTSSRLRRLRLIQNFHLVWLDEKMDETKQDFRNSMTKLRQIINTINTFINADECIQFIDSIKDEKVFVISSGALGQTTVPVLHNKTQVNTIYIFCKAKDYHEKWVRNWSKVAGVYTDMTSICNALKQAALDCDQNSVSISFVQKNDEIENEKLYTLDCSFMYTQILKEILLTIDFDQEYFKLFLIYCSERLAGNDVELKNVNTIEKEYGHHQPIWWYTYNCFLYSMLNRALRTMEIDLIATMGFFVRDLHKDITELHIQQYGGKKSTKKFTVYRGQGLSQADFDQLKTTQSGLLAFNNFLSTSTNSKVSLKFAQRTIKTSDNVGIFFVMTIDPSIAATPFANIKNVSYYKGEEEILFSMHSVFRIGQVKQIDKKNNRLWQVNLTLTEDQDPQLQKLTKSMQDETKGPTGWFRLGRLMIKVAQYDKAQQVFETILDQTMDAKGIGEIYYYLGWIKKDHEKYTEALSYYEKALAIFENMIPANHSDLATSYDSIGSVYSKTGKYSKALSFHKKALKIFEETLPANHPDLATSYNNIGLVYHNMSEYSNALSSHEKAHEIQQKTLPPNHPSLATSYSNIGSVYENMGDYSKAISFHEKALEIFEKTLPPNHPSLATSYSNIGSVYHNMGDYSKALSFHGKALEIRQKTLPRNQPSLAISYNNIGSTYYNMGEYSKALSSHKKAMEIFEKTLPSNHPSLATSYNNIELVYAKMGEYSKALAYKKRALDIEQCSRPLDRPRLVNMKEKIETVKKKL